MAYAHQRGVPQIRRYQDACWQRRANPCFDRRYIPQPRAGAGARQQRRIGQRDIGVPNAIEAPGNGPLHAGQVFHALQIGKAANFERVSDRQIEVLCLGWSDKPSSQPRGKLRQSHNLAARFRIAAQPQSGACETPAVLQQRLCGGSFKPTTLVAVSIVSAFTQNSEAHESPCYFFGLSIHLSVDKRGVSSPHTLSGAVSGAYQRHEHGTHRKFAPLSSFG